MFAYIQKPLVAFPLPSKDCRRTPHKIHLLVLVLVFMVRWATAAQEVSPSPNPAVSAEEQRNTIEVVGSNLRSVRPHPMIWCHAWDGSDDPIPVAGTYVKHYVKSVDDIPYFIKNSCHELRCDNKDVAFEKYKILTGDRPYYVDEASDRNGKCEVFKSDRSHREYGHWGPDLVIIYLEHTDADTTAGWYICKARDTDAMVKEYRHCGTRKDLEYTLEEVTKPLAEIFPMDIAKLIVSFVPPSVDWEQLSGWNNTINGCISSIKIPENPYKIGDPVKVYSVSQHKWYDDGCVTDANVTQITVVYNRGQSKKLVEVAHLSHCVKPGQHKLEIPYKVGDRVKIWSNSKRKWFEDGHVISVDAARIQVQYNNDQLNKYVWVNGPPQWVSDLSKVLKRVDDSSSS